MSIPATKPLPAAPKGLPPKLPPLPGASNGNATAAPAVKRDITIKTGNAGRAQKIVIYGTGGIGKTSLAALAPNPIIIDLDGGADHIDVPRIDDVETYDDLRAVLNSEEVKAFGTIVIDSATQACELIAAKICNTIPLEKGGRAKNLEDYGYGKGYNHLYEHFLLMLQGFDALVRRGQNIILIAHDCTGSVPNPGGDDWIRYEPRVWQSKNGNNSLRQRLKEWADHLLFIQYDLSVKEGKAEGFGSRTVYPQEQAAFMAKSRTLRDPWPFFEGDTELWNRVFGAAANGTIDTTSQGEQ